MGGANRTQRPGPQLEAETMAGLSGGSREWDRKTDTAIAQDADEGKKETGELAWLLLSFLYFSVSHSASAFWTQLEAR